MSGYIVGRVLWADLPMHLKLTAVILADCADDSGHCFPGVSRIATQLGQGKRQVLYNIAALRERGILTTHARGKPGGGRSSNAYRFDLDRLPHPPPKAKVQPIAPIKGQPIAPLDGQRCNPLHDQRCNQGGAKVQSSAEKAPQPVELGNESRRIRQIEPSEGTGVRADKKRRPRATPIRCPADWQPDAKTRAWIESFGVPFDTAKPAVAEFVGYWSGRTTKRADWQQSFRRNGKVEATLIRLRDAANPGPSFRRNQPPERPEPVGAAYRPLDLP